VIGFACRGIAWSLGLFGLIRLPWFEAAFVAPLTRIQAQVATALFGRAVAPVEVTLACSGADALALCAGVILAYPAASPLRILGAAAGTALILILNTLRIGTLGRAADSLYWFEALHLYIWPFVLTCAIAAYVYTWMRFANLRTTPPGPDESAPSSGLVTGDGFPAATRRFIFLSVPILLVFLAAAPLYLESGVVLAVAESIARSAAVVLGLMGFTAGVMGNVLSTSRGAFMVTQECIVTPLVPIYVAGILAHPGTWLRRGGLLLLGFPLFFALGVARLLVVALPASIVESPLFLVHAFYQFILAFALVVVAAHLGQGASGKAVRPALTAMALGASFTYFLGTSYARFLATATGAALPLTDPQGALLLLPAFQVGLFVALSVAAFKALPVASFLTGLTLLCLSQAALFALLPVAEALTGLAPHVREVRGWALAAPVLLCGVLALEKRGHLWPQRLRRYARP
jgi:exosortase/archaeosortase family protein